MRKIFFSVFAVLAVWSVWIYASLPEQEQEVPVIYWVTDRNPARDQQVALFQEWLAENHPKVSATLLLDMGNRDLQKQIVQGVSGVGGDIQDLAGSTDVPLLYRMGIVSELDDVAEPMGFGLDTTFEAIRPLLTVERDGRSIQVAYPCNVGSQRYFVNRGVLEELDFPMPPDTWTVETFEDYGKRFVAAANADNPPRRRFLVMQLPMEEFYRSFGVDLFNETLTGSGLNERPLTPDGTLADEPGLVSALRKLYQWTYVDNILPTPSQLAGMNTEGGYGGTTIVTFERGDFALLAAGRWHLIKMRETNVQRVADGLEPLRLSTTQYPHRYMPNVIVGTRAAIVYSASEHPELATLFLSFLASESYNRNIIDDADGLPPNPRYCADEAYARPPTDPQRGIYPETEWNVHARLLADIDELAIADSKSPFLAIQEADRQRMGRQDLFMNGLISVEEAGLQTERRIRREMQRSIDEMLVGDPRLALFEEWSALQVKVDEYKAAGKPIPIEWIKNPFYVKYYRHIGMLDESGGASADVVAMD
ncbi:MAG: ABC transporter substrate-binding protein [Planctomycetota bacterium]